MSVFYFLAAFILINRLNKSLLDFDLKFKWNRILLWSNWGVAILFLVVQSLLEGGLNDIIGSAVLLGILIYINKEPDFSGFRFYVWANYPLAGIGLITGLTQLIAPDFYDKYEQYFIYAILAAFVWPFARWMSSKKQREELKTINMRNQQLDTLVAQRTAQLTEQKNELQNTVELLKATQAQLIQQEKLASLGELTAGIAHEIQNPLNFVNNFSEVSKEMIEEMKEEIDKGDIDEVKLMASDIEQNLEKIIHHGKRADAIVKGMLQHSRISTGLKELTDINALADEYMRLAYHGLRAKDNTFSAELNTDFNNKIGKIDIISQDIGRVLLNLFNNAFYAVTEKAKTAGPAYHPAVMVNTKRKDDKVIITVSDNGNGIPPNVTDKIFQPFFTTKPTGQGTGLGLSLSYDIIKAHGGEIKVETKEGEGAKFIISLPVT